MKRIYFLVFVLLAHCFCNGQIITTTAGDGSATYSGDGVTALLTGMKPNGLVFDPMGNIFFVDAGNCRIRKIDTHNIVTTVAGNGDCTYWGDGGPATDAKLYAPVSIAIDASGNLYISTAGDHRVRKISTTGIITTIAGTGAFGYNGDNIPATSAQLFYPYVSVIDNAGNVLLSDGDNHRIRSISPAGIISTIAGGSSAGHSGDGGPATNALLRAPEWMAYSSSGDLYISDNTDRCIRKINAAGIITTFAGTPGVVGNTGDNGPATSATFSLPNGLALDDTGNLYIADYGASVIRKVSTSGIITTIGGTGTSGFSGDGGLAILAKMTPNDVAINNGNIYIADLENNRLRKITYSSLGVPPTTRTGTDIKVSPNPTNDLLQIDNITTAANYQVSTILGTSVQHGVLKTGSNTISIRALPTGMYLLEFIDDEGNKTVKKIIKE